MYNEQKLTRGTVVWISFPYANPGLNPHAAYGRRPALIITPDWVLEMSPTMIVYPITTSSDPKYSKFHPYIKVPGSMKSSFVMCEQPITVDKSIVESVAGCITDDEMRYVEEAICYEHGIEEKRVYARSSNKPIDKEKLKLGIANVIDACL